jgi:hypothetical protein
MIPVRPRVVYWGLFNELVHESVQLATRELSVRHGSTTLPDRCDQRDDLQIICAV